MAWIKLDEGFSEHPKLVAVGPIGLALWACGLGYCNRNLTDGFIPAGVAHRLIDWPDAELIVTRLLDAGVWHEADGGYEVHDYLDYQPSREAVDAERKKTAAKVAKWRERKRNQGSNPVTNRPVTPAPDTDTDTHTPSGVDMGRHGVASVWSAYEAHHPTAKLTGERRALIQRRLGEYDVATLVAAIEGNHRSAYHCGDNPDGKKYHDLGLILRSADKIESFAAMAGETPVDRLTRKKKLSARELAELAQTQRPTGFKLLEGGGAA